MPTSGRKINPPLAENPIEKLADREGVFERDSSMPNVDAGLTQQPLACMRFGSWRPVSVFLLLWQLLSDVLFAMALEMVLDVATTRDDLRTDFPDKSSAILESSVSAPQAKRVCERLNAVAIGLPYTHGASPPPCRRRESH